MLTDRYGLALTTTSPAARDAYVAGADCVLSAEAGAEAHLARAIEADPGFALAHMALARAHFLIANVAEARAAAARARELAPRTSAREQGHINTLALAIEGKPVEAFAAMQTHLKEHPRDALVAAPATGVFGMIGFSGRQEREPEQVAFLDALKPHYGDDWWFRMVYAFAVEEMGRLDEALDLIEASMAANPKSAHGAHIKGHVLYEMGEDAAALAYLEQWMPAYPKAGPMHCHLSWHVALFALTIGQAEKAWAVYEAQVHPGGSWGPPLNSVTDSISFLWRAELAGEARRAEFWPQARAHAQKCFPKAGIAFVDVHTALASAATGEEAALARITAEVEERLASGKYPSGGIVPALASGLAAYAAGNWSKAAGILEAARAETVRIGGSRAQRDLLENTLLAAYLKDGRAEAAKALVAKRADRRPMVPVAGLGQAAPQSRG